MEDEPVIISDMAARPSMTVRFYYSKRNYPSNSTAKRSPTFTEGQTLPNGIPTNHESRSSNTVGFEVGDFYEIDQGSLPPKSPAQLKFIRVVVVNDKNKLGVTVAFPSLLSLREYFKMEDKTHGKRKLQSIRPDLDEQFVMSTNHAVKILKRLLPQPEVDAAQQLERFWLVTPLLTTDGKECKGSDRSNVGPNLKAALQSAEVSSWGVRRRVTYISRNNKGKSPFPSLDVAVAKEEETLVKVDASENAETPGTGPKKKRKYKKSKKPKLELERLSSGYHDRTKSSKDRWSPGRYASAELKLVDIMMEKGAVLGNPILRPHLREEARKHIGDTGLLDHLLKHMAGKVVLDGKVRFRRRHNSEGAMEYWLEDANLDELRVIAGVEDTAWVPPPGWAPTSPCCNPCGLELSQVKEELSNLRRELEQLCIMKQKHQEEEEDRQKDKSENNPPEPDATSTIIQEMHNELVEWKATVSEQLSKMATSLQEIKEEVGVLREEMREVKESIATEEEGGRKWRRSGFRVCKPQGSFLWPADMRTYGLVVEEQGPHLFEVPTPPSASSVTSPPNPNPPVHARADVLLVPPSSSSRHPMHMQMHHSEVAPGASHHSLFPSGMIALQGGSPFSGKKKGWSPVDGGGAWNSTATISTDLALASPTYRP